MKPIGARSLVGGDRPTRLLLWATLLVAFGRGVFTSSVIVFLATVFDLDAGRIGLAMTGAGLAAVTVAVPAGHLSDRWGARRTAVTLVLCQAAAVVPFLFVHAHLAVTALVVGLGAVDRAGSIARRALVPEVMGPTDRVRTQAYLRSTMNVGMSIGALVAAPALAIGTRTAFSVLVLAAVAAYVCCAVVTVSLPTRMAGETGPAAAAPLVKDGPAPASPARRLTSVAALGLVNGLLALHVSILNVGLPLWLTGHTDAPGWTVAAMLVVNTVLAVVFQPLLSRTAEDVRGAARTLAASAAFSAVSCVLFAGTAGRGGQVLLAVVLLSVVVLTVAELLQSAGDWGLSFGLAPAREQGRYAGIFSAGSALEEIYGPALVVSVAISQGPNGWFYLACVIGAGGLAVVPMTHAATKSRIPSEA
ncbi:MFS transporter [Streptomyces sp. NPDC050856]|uniref:MFS transporter n=1 Tax=Streptomyces sp. NPDC050856 TaxID=3154939 RepID=UPI0033C71E8E